jgi:hypothetical protein
MATAVYATDLTLIDDAQAVGNFVATGGGGASIGDETDYFINDAQCISKTGFTATQKGIMADDVSAPSITAGDAVFIWGRNANRNIMDTIANQGGSVIMGTSNAVFAGFNVDGSNIDGSLLLSWVNYAVDPTQTSSYTSGTPGAASTWDHFGMEWKILSSGSLKGSPVAVGVIRYGRELQVTEGFTVLEGSFEGAAAWDNDNTRKWGILTPVAGGYLFHGAFVMGTTTTAVDFVDSGRSISVQNDPFLPAGFNEFEIRNASSTVSWTNIIISHLGTNTPSVLTLDVGTFTGSACQFNGFSTTIFNSSSTCQATWTSCAAVTAAGADLSGSNILTPNVSANTSGLIWNVNTDPTGLLDNMTFSKTSGTAHHAIEFGVDIPTSAITLNGCNFGTDFSAGLDTTVGDETFHFKDTTGTITLNLVGCTGNKGYRSEGVIVTIVDDPVTTQFTVTDSETPPVAISGARVFVETSDGTGPLPFEEAVTIVQTSGTATVTHTAHGIPDGTNVVIRGATQNGYNKVAAISVVNANSYTYSVDAATVSPATGSPIASGVIVHGTTNGSGIISDVRVFSSSQPFKGTIRASSGSPYYQPATLTGTVSNTAGFAANIALLSDE